MTFAVTVKMSPSSRIISRMVLIASQIDIDFDAARFISLPQYGQQSHIYRPRGSQQLHCRR